MLPSRGLRWAGTGISNGRQRLMLRGVSTRNFSINAASASSPRFSRVSPSSRSTFVQQSRSLSLFGWGSSSKSTPDTLPQSTADIEIGPSTTGLDNVRAVKASHATSDAPDPTQTHFQVPNPTEPQIIENLQESITIPHGAAGARIAEITSGQADITAAAEQMGYLKDVCGLDFGWGPSAMMENLLEALHVYGGLGWTASIITLATILRVAMFYPILISQLQGKKMRDVQPFTAPLRQKQMALLKAGDQAKAVEVAAELREINKEAGVSYMKAFVPLLIQLPFSFGAFRVLRNAGQLPVPAFVSEDWLWTTDLSFSDPYYLAPLISSATIYLSFRFQQQGGNTMFGPEMMKLLGIAFPAMSFIFMSWQPGSVQLYFMTTGILAFATTSILRQLWFRNIVGLGPLPTPAVTPVATPTAAPVQKDLPSGIQMLTQKKAQSTTSVETEIKPTVKKSVFDVAVDSGKDWGASVTKSTKSVAESWLGTPEDRAQKAQKDAAARYHATRQRQIDAEREERNQRGR